MNSVTYTHSSSKLLIRIEHGFLHNVWNIVDITSPLEILNFDNSIESYDSKLRCPSFRDTLYINIHLYYNYLGQIRKSAEGFSGLSIWKIENQFSLVYTIKINQHWQQNLLSEWPIIRVLLMFTDYMLKGWHKNHNKSRVYNECD